MARFPNILFATVVSTKDPDKLARVQVEVLGFGQKLELPWIRTLQGLAGKAHGSLVLPEEGDEVVVLCGAGSEPDGMIVLGGVYNSETKPAQSNDDGKNALKQVQTKGGHRITLDDTKGAELIEVVAAKEKISIKMQVKEGILCIEADKEIEVVSAADITVDAKDTVTVKAAKKLVVDAAEVTVNASGKCVVEGVEVSVSGTNVTVEASAGCTVSGSAKVDITGGAINIG
jgi:uncharacterized protein involved in type VI secretion and phage assembly